MSILLGHSSIRPLTGHLQAINMVLEKERLGFALVSREGFLRAVNTLFLDTYGKKTLSLGTISLGEVEKTFTAQTPPGHAGTITAWFRGEGSGEESFWHATVPFGKGSLDLFRAVLTNSGAESVLLFRKREEKTAHASSDIAKTYFHLSDPITLILLDSLDHETMIGSLSDEFWDQTEVADPPQMFLWNTPRWKKGSNLILVTPRLADHGEAPLTTALSAMEPQKVLQAISIPVSRTVFLRESGHEGIHVIIPLVRETSFFGWITQRLSLDMKKAQPITQSIGRIGNELSLNLFKNREQLRLICLINRDQESGLPSRRGLIDGLTDLLEVTALKDQGVGLVGVTLSDPVGIAPMRDVLLAFARQSDLLGRFSPMEFLLILPNQSRSGTEKAARRLESTLLTRNSQQVRLASRVSFCHAPEDGHSPLRLMRAAFMDNVRTVGSVRDGNPFTS